MTRLLFYLLFPAVLLSWTACDTAREAQGTNFLGSGGDYGGPPITESLFDYKDRTISEEDIRRILDGQIRLRDTVRLAIFQFGGVQTRAVRWYDERTLTTHQALIDTFVQALQSARRVQKVILLPALVTGYRPNIQQLRESAVRLQADMLLVYTLNSDLFQKYRAFKKEEAKAYATCEAVLMDVRTGVIPYTDIVTTSAQSVKDRTDFEPAELNMRALNMATLQALLGTGKKVATFLDEQK